MTTTFTGFGAVAVLALCLCALYAFCAFMDWTFKMAVGGAPHSLHSSEGEPNPSPIQWIEVESLEPERAQTTLDDFAVDEAQTTLEDFMTHECANTCTGECRHAHMVWATNRARDYLPDVSNARASLLSDLGKHPETEGMQEMFAPMLMLAPFNAQQFESFINGFGLGSCDCAQEGASDAETYEEIMAALARGLEEE